MAQEEIRLDRYVIAIWRAKWFIIGATLLAGIITIVLITNEPIQYSSTALIQIGRVWKEPLEDPFLTVEIINSEGFSSEVAQKLDIKQGLIRKSIKAETITVGPQRSAYPILVRITANTANPEDSARFIQAAAEETVARHEKMFDESMRQHIERQRRLEAMQAEMSKDAAAKASDLGLRLERELDEVKSSNTSPALTEKTQALGRPSRSIPFKQDYKRSAATAALVAFFAAIFLSMLWSHISEFRSSAKSRETEEERKQADA